MKGLKLALAGAVICSSLAANAGVLDFNHRAMLLNEKANSCGGTATLRFERYEAVLILNTAICRFVEVGSGPLLPNRVHYRFSLNRRHKVLLTSGRNFRHADLLEVNTFVP